MRRNLILLVFAASALAAACGSSSTAPKAITVSQVGLSWDAGTSPCGGSVNMTFTVQVDNAAVGDTVVVDFTGSGLPATISQSLTASSQLIQKQYTVPAVSAGTSATWTALVLSVGGQTPDTLPGRRRTAQANITC